MVCHPERSEGSAGGCRFLATLGMTPKKLAMSRMRLTVNGTQHDLDVEGHETLLGVLRDRLALTGTKLSCGRGECGACTVLLAEPGGDRRPVYACLTLVAGCEDCSVTTIEGLSNGSGALHPLQEAFIAHD